MQKCVWVYVTTTSKKDECKIGIANDVDRRRQNQKSGNALALQTCLAVPFPQETIARQVESRVLSELQEWRTPDARAEWVKLPPDEVSAVVRKIAIECGQIIYPSLFLSKGDPRTLREIEKQAVCLFNKLGSDYIYGEQDGAEDFEEASIPDILGLLCLVNQIDRPEEHIGNNGTGFNDLLNTTPDGQKLLAAFKRKPDGCRLSKYLDKAEEQKMRIGHHWLEWSRGRDLTRIELDALSIVWDKYVSAYNSVAKGLYPDIRAGKSDDVGIYLSPYEKKGHEICFVVFKHNSFRAVLIPKRPVKLDNGDFELLPLGEASLRGFVIPSLSYDKPFLQWLNDDAHSSRDRELKHFLNNPDGRYVVQPGAAKLLPEPVG